MARSDLEVQVVAVKDSTKTTTKTDDELFEHQSGRILRFATKKVHHGGKERLSESFQQRGGVKVKAV